MDGLSRLGLGGIPRSQLFLTTAAATGTALDNLTAAQVVAGGETIILTLTNAQWLPAGASFDAVRQDIIDGLDSSGGEANGWNVEVRDKEVVTAVVRTSDTVVTITLSAAALYSVTSAETITVTVPGSAVEGMGDFIATPGFQAGIAASAGSGPFLGELASDWFLLRD